MHFSICVSSLLSYINTCMSRKYVKLVKDLLAEKFVDARKIKPFASNLRDIPDNMYVELFINPTKKELGSAVRGIVLPSGDLYTLNTEAEINHDLAVIHVDILRVLRDQKLTPYDVDKNPDYGKNLTEFFAMQYNRESNMWGKGESYEPFTPKQEEQAKQFIVKAKEKNPGYNFTTERKQNNAR